MLAWRLRPDTMSPKRSMAALLALLMLVSAAPLVQGWHHDDDFQLVAEVRDGSTGDPVANASVVITDVWERPLLFGATDGDGFYETRLANGDYRMIVDADGYFELRDGFHGWGGERYQKWWLEPAATGALTLAGRVTDTNGSALSNVSVSATADYLHRNEWGEWWERAPYGDTVTDGGGNYTIALRDGEGSMVFTLDGYFEVHYWENFSQRAENENTTALQYNATLTAMDETGVLRGYIRDAHGDPLPGANIDFQHEFPYRAKAYSDADGYYELTAAKGNYSGSEVWLDGFHNHNDWNATIFTLGDEYWYNVSLVPRDAEVQHSGTVYDARRLPVANASVELVYQYHAPGPAAGEVLKYHYTWNATTAGTNGQFQIGAPQCGNYHLRATAPGYHPSEEAWVDSCRDNLLVEIFLPPAQNATVGGQITFPNGTAAVGWYVSFDEIDHGGQARYTHVRNATCTNATGHYEMDFWGVPTQIQVHHNESYRYADYEYYEWDRRFNAGINTFDIELRPSQSNVVAGRVTNATGAPVAGVAVSGENWFGWNTTTTDAAGYYELGMLTDTEDWFDVWWEPPHRAGLHQHYNQFYFDEGEHITYNVTLEPLGRPAGEGTLYGFITWPNGTAVDWAEVEAHTLAQWGWHHANHTSTIAGGYYEMNISAGDFELWAWTDGAYPNRTRGHLDVNDFLQVDMVLTPHPPRDRLLCGYVNTTNGSALAGAQVFWGLMADQQLRKDREHRQELGLMFDDFASFALDWTYTNATGYYELWVPESRLYTGVFDLAGDNEGSQTRFIDVPAGGQWLNYTLGAFVYPAYTLSGEVQVPDGQPWDADVLLLEVGDFLGDRYTRASGGGRFSFPVTPGEYVLVIDEGDNDAVVERITITGNHSDTWVLGWPERTLVNRTLLFDDWSTATLYQNATLWEDAVLARFMADYYFGDDDGSISAAEAVRVAEEAYWNVLGGQATLLPGGTSHGAFALEEVHYAVDPATFSVALTGAVGSVQSTAPLVVRGSQELAAMTAIPSGDDLDFGLWTPYEEAVMRYHYTIEPPATWALDGHNDADNIDVNASGGRVTVVPQGDPRPWDDIWEAWVELYFASTMELLVLEPSTMLPEPGVPFTLNVTAAGAPVAGAQVVVSWYGNGSETANLTADAAGQVTLNLTDGLYWAAATRSGYRDGKLLLDVAPAGARLTALFVPAQPTVRDSITMTVVNSTGAPVSFTNYRIVDEADGSVIRDSFTDIHGNATFNLLPGEYLVTLNRTGYHNGTLFLVVETLKLRLSIEPLYPVQGEAINVTLVDEDGYPVAGATLRLIWINNGTEVWSGITNASGMATLTGLEGQYRLEATKSGYVSDSYEITVHPYDEHNPEREGESFLPGPGLLLGVIAFGLVARRRRRLG